MKALIFNSGLGSRLGELTLSRPKSMVQLGNGETIFHRQLRILYACGITDFVVTTGPFAEQLEAEAVPFSEQGCSFTFVNNPVYDSTNYIYSMWLARDYLKDSDYLVLHGDLVFDVAYAQKVIDSDEASLGSVNTGLSLPEKDFKARVIDGQVREVSVGIFDDDCLAFQPFYKLSKEALKTWLDAVDEFVSNEQTGVYAENAANMVFADMAVEAFSYDGHFVEEVDTPEDLQRVSDAIRLYDFAQQPVYYIREEAEIAGIENGIRELHDAHDVVNLLSTFGIARPLVVSTSSFPKMRIASLLSEAGIDYIPFTEFHPNPTASDVECAVEAYRYGGCDSLLSVGGGSAIDVAKCTKQLLAMSEASSGDNLAADTLPFAEVTHIAVPTTAGTGSESTHFAVCYIDGKKVSVAGDSLLPDAVILDPTNLIGLPDYQKKSTVLDALCQAVESYWSVRSCDQSKAYSTAAIPAIMNHAKAYLENDLSAADIIMRAANQAGKAINLTTTTAPHAMSYKLTSLYRIPHGHAVAMCMPYCWQLLIDQGDTGLQGTLSEIAALMTGNQDATAEDGLKAFNSFFDDMNIDRTVVGTADDIAVLTGSVNAQRLSNFPLVMTETDIEIIYRQIVTEEG